MNHGWAPTSMSTKHYNINTSSNARRSLERVHTANNSNSRIDRTIRGVLSGACLETQKAPISTKILTDYFEFYNPLNTHARGNESGTTALYQT